MRKLLSFAAALLSVAVLSTGDVAQAADRKRGKDDAKIEKPAPVELPPAVPPGQSTRMMALGRLISRLPVGTRIGRTCIILGFGGTDILTTTATQEFTYTGFNDIFNDEARKAGYTTYDPKGQLFDSGEKPQLLLGAIVTSIDNAIVCPKSWSSGHVVYEFQVYDTLERKVVWTGIFDGTSDRKELTAYYKGRGEISVGEKKEIGDVWYVDLVGTPIISTLGPALQKMLRDPGFVAIATGGMPASATLNTPTPVTAAPQAEARKIANQPLSQVPFGQHVNALREEVVTIFSSDGMGSGFYITPDLLLTNHHVIAGSKYVKVKFLNGKETVGEVLSSNPRRDIALLKTEVMPVRGLPLRLEPPVIGNRVFVIGSPIDKALQGSVSSGIVSAFRNFEATGSIYSGKYIQSDVAVNHGNSGGPMFDEFGNVIGLTDLGSPDPNAKGLNFFIPIDDALKVLNVEIMPTASASAAKP